MIDKAPVQMKKIVIVAIIVLVSIGLLEMGTRFIYLAVFDEHYDHNSQTAKVLVVATSNSTLGDKSSTNKKAKLPYPLHPYIGFTARPNGSRKQGRYNDYGFLGEDPLSDRKPSEVMVAITGGSVAAGVFTFAGERLREALASAYPGKDILLTGIALGGMKQPQQLMAMNYFLTLGSSFDVIINLDGYNEAVLSMKNYRKGVAPFYPRAWSLYAQKSLDIERAILITELASLAGTRQVLARAANSPLLRNSAFVLTAWQLLDNRLYNAIYRTEARLWSGELSKEEAPQVTGPNINYGDEKSAESFVLDIWENASRQMSRLAVVNEIEYYHFLQPNQHFKGSKSLSDAEKKLVDKDKGDGIVARTMYPLMRDRLELIQQRGDIHIFDLTQIYVDLTETLYIDSCCHVNTRGYQLIADAIAGQIISVKASETSQDSARERTH